MDVIERTLATGPRVRYTVGIGMEMFPFSLDNEWSIVDVPRSSQLKDSFARISKECMWWIHNLKDWHSVCLMKSGAFPCMAKALDMYFTE